MIYYNEECLPCVGVFGHPLMKVYAVLTIGRTGDCAAYRGIGPDVSRSGSAALDEVLQSIAQNGNKMREMDAKALFPEIAEQGLRYRK